MESLGALPDSPSESWDGELDAVTPARPVSVTQRADEPAPLVVPESPLSERAPPSRSAQSKFQSREMFFPTASNDATLIDCFVIAGVREQAAEVREAEALFCFPAAVDPKRLATIVKFCFPEKVASRVVRRSRSGSSLNQLVHGSDQAFSRRHVFCMGVQDGGFEWGCVLVKEELLAILPSVLGANATAAAAEMEKQSEFGAADRAYCVVSRYPLFSLHFDLLLSLLSHERALRLISSPANESPVLEELNRALNVWIDRTINQTIHLDLYSRQVSLELPFLEFSDNLDTYFSELVMQQTMPALLQRLSLPNVLRIFNAALLCKQILFRSRFCGVASAVCLATSLLIRPLRWEGLLVPVLPASMKTALMAPVPFVIGVAGHAVKFDDDLSIDGLLVDVDVDKVFVLSKFPSLPASAQLANNLEPILAKFFSRLVTPRPAFDPSADQKMASLQAFACFTAYGKWLIGKLIIHLDSDASIATPKALKESFLPTVTSGNRSFVHAWLNTQHMSVFLQQEFAKRIK